MRIFSRWLPSVAWLLALMLVAVAPARAGQVSTTSQTVHVAIQGYDPVGYFADGKAIKGSTANTYIWQGAKWLFAGRAHKDMFAADPGHYVPQYRGFCARALAEGELYPADPRNWAILGGKLYLTAGTQQVTFSEWRANAQQFIPQADQNWHALMAKPAQ